MKYRLVVFDWDGTVIDSPGAIVECMQEASRDLGLPVPEPERASHVIGLGLHDAMKIVALKRGALVELHRMLREGQVEKVYLAAAKGAWEGGARELRESLHKYVDAKGERRVAVREDGMKAVTRVRALKKSADFSLLEVRLLTGRTHQIRVHLAHAGHPVLGDSKYGDFELNRRLEKQGVRRLFLHASRLAFAHPVTRERLELHAPLPTEMEKFIEKTWSVPDSSRA